MALRATAAATVAATMGAWRGSRILGSLLVLPTLLLTVGTVYGQMHYGVDALAGLAVPFLVAPGLAAWSPNANEGGGRPAPALAACGPGRATA